jgi:hypothetical protein
VGLEAVFKLLDLKQAAGIKQEATATRLMGLASREVEHVNNGT